MSRQLDTGSQVAARGPSTVVPNSLSAFAREAAPVSFSADHMVDQQYGPCYGASLHSPAGGDSRRVWLATLLATIYKGMLASEESLPACARAWVRLVPTAGRSSLFSAARQI